MSFLKLKSEVSAKEGSALRKRIPMLLGTLLVIILISRLLLVTFSVDSAGDDGLRYLTTAHNLVTYGVMSRLGGPNPSPTSHDMPLFILLLSSVISFFGERNGIYVIGALNALFFTLAALGVYKITMQLFREELIGYLALGFFAVLPENIAYSVTYMPESMFIAFLIWAVFWLLKFWHERKGKFLVLAAVLLGLSVLTKGISAFFFVVAAVVVFLIQGVSWKKRLGWAILLSIIAISTTLPWFFRNYETFGTFSISTITGTNLFYFYGVTLEDAVGKEKATQITSDWESKLSKIYGSEWQNPFVRSKALGAVARDALLKDPLSYVVSVLKHQSRVYIGSGTPQLLRLLGDSEDAVLLRAWSANPSFSSFFKLPPGVIAIQVVSWLVMIFFYLSVVSGFYLLLKKKMIFPAIVLGLGLVYFIVFTGPLTNTRYRVPMTLFLSPVAAVAISHLLSSRSRNASLQSPAPVRQ